MSRWPVPLSSQFWLLARESPACIVAEPGRPEGGASIRPRGCGRGGRWSSFEQYRRLAVQSLRMALFVMDDDLPGVAQVRVLLSRAVSFCSESFRDA